MRSAGAPSARHVIAIGGSAGAFETVLAIVSALPADFDPTVLLCLHLHPTDGGQMARHLTGAASIPVLEVSDKMAMAPGHLYVAPANYHLLLERTGTLALCTGPKVLFCRPSIDVLFDSAARALRHRLLAILLSGANPDGAAGLATVVAMGGEAIVQDPAEAASPAMALAALGAGVDASVLRNHQIRQRLLGHPHGSIHRAATRGEAGNPR